MAGEVQLSAARSLLIHLGKLMMKIRQTIDRLQGIGRVEVDGEFVCEADYDIQVDQEMVGRSGSIPGLLRLSGTVCPQGMGEMPELFLKEGLSLTMTDGRWFKFCYADFESKAIVVQSIINKPRRRSA